MDKKYIVSFYFTAEFQGINDADALEQAASQMLVGFEDTRKLTLAVVAAIPIAKLAEAKAVQENDTGEKESKDIVAGPEKSVSA